MLISASAQGHPSTLIWSGWFQSLWGRCRITTPKPSYPRPQAHPSMSYIPSHLNQWRRSQSLRYPCQALHRTRRQWVCLLYLYTDTGCCKWIWSGKTLRAKTSQWKSSEEHLHPSFLPFIHLSTIHPSNPIQSIIHQTSHLLKPVGAKSHCYWKIKIKFSYKCSTTIEERRRFVVVVLVIVVVVLVVVVIYSTNQQTERWHMKSCH